MNKIMGTPVQLDVLLNDRYTVHYYQREYSWQRKQIEELIEDLTSEFLEYHQEGHTQKDVAKYGNYFLGPIIVTDEKAIIDGQQRLSSLTLLLIYLNRLQINFSTKVSIDNLIYSAKYGQKTFSINVEEREACLEGLFEDGEYDITNEPIESVITLYNRFKDIEEIYPDNLKTEEVLPLFISWLIYNVTLIKITTTSEQDAHKVFVTMNDRGLRLTPTDMLKGYLLSEITDNTDRNKANDLWKRQILKLKETQKDGDADFIKDWLRAQYANTIREGKKGSEDKDFEIIGQTFHKWVRDNKNIIGLDKSIDFESFVLKEFNVFGKTYLRLKEYSETFCKEYEYVFYNADRGFTLQPQVILAALTPTDTNEIIDKKIKVVSCFIDQFIARRVFNFKTMDYSSIRYTVFNLTKKVRRKTVEELKEVLVNYLLEMEQTLEGIDDFYLNQFTGRYMLHIISRMTYYVEEKSGINSSFNNYVDRTQKNSYDIEHIWANDYEQGNHKTEFTTEEEFSHFRNRFGGLLILPKDKNRSLQDMEYTKKIDKYDSENLLARTLNPNCYINNPLFLRFEQQENIGFKACSNFEKQDLLERQQVYKGICKKIWDVEMIRQIVK